MLSSAPVDPTDPKMQGAKAIQIATLSSKRKLKRKKADNEGAPKCIAIAAEKRKEWEKK